MKCWCGPPKLCCVGRPYLVPAILRATYTNAGTGSLEKTPSRLLFLRIWHTPQTAVSKHYLNIQTASTVLTFPDLVSMQANSYQLNCLLITHCRRYIKELACPQCPHGASPELPMCRFPQSTADAMISHHAAVCYGDFPRRRSFTQECEYLYTFSHCESAPSQLNAAWGNSFRQLHSNFDNLLALRQISLE